MDTLIKLLEKKSHYYYDLNIAQMFKSPIYDMFFLRINATPGLSNMVMTKFFLTFEFFSGKCP